MDALSLINKSLDVEKLITHFGFNANYEDDHFIRCPCAIHGGSNPTSFVINLENGFWFCHAECGGGDAVSLVQHFEGVGFAQAVQWLAEFFDVDISGLTIAEKSEQHIKELKSWINAIRSRKKKEKAEPFSIHNVRNVKAYKSFLQSTIEHFGLVYCESMQLTSKKGSTFTLRERLAFPIVDNGVQVGASFRAVKPNQEPKWLHAPTFLDMKNYLYNYDNIIEETEIVICEGITDVWAFHEINVPAVATYGAHLSDEQYKKIMRLGCDVVIAYDGDKAGQLATEKAIKLLKNKCTIKQIKMEEGEDPESIERSDLRERFQNRRYCN